MNHPQTPPSSVYGTIVFHEMAAKKIGHHCPSGSPSQQDRMGMRITWEAFSNDIAIPCRDCDRALRAWHVNSGNTHTIGKTKKKCLDATVP